MAKKFGRIEYKPPEQGAAAFVLIRRSQVVEALRPICIDWHRWWVAGFQSETHKAATSYTNVTATLAKAKSKCLPGARDHHAGGDDLDGVQKAGIDELHESGDIGAIAGLAHIIPIHKVTRCAGQCNA